MGGADDGAVKTARLAVNSRVFPLIEVLDGVQFAVREPSNRHPVKDYLAQQKRYRHLTNADIFKLQDVDQEWDRLTQRAKTAGGR